MIKITVNDLILNCHVKLLIGNKTKEITECFIDSKKVVNNSTFIGIKGKNMDGSFFYKEAFDNGADICIINKIYDLDLKGYDDKTVLIAKDTRSFLKEFAAYKRSLFKGNVIMITGSVGKTTTKEMISNVLSKKYKILKTEGNLNNEIGLPLTILKLKDEDIMVLEAGMNNLGEIHNLSMIAKPDVAIITNVFSSHIGNLKTKENILKAKLEIIDGMNEGKLIINNDNDMLNKWYNKQKNKENIITVGIDSFSDIKVYDIRENSFSIENEEYQIFLPYNFIYNALLTYVVSKMFDINNQEIKDVFKNFGNLPHRLERINLDNNITLIDDCYNASYESVSTALEYISTFNGRKIAVLADILELGNESLKIHESLAKEVIKNNVDILVTIGKYSKCIGKKSSKLGLKRKNIKHFSNEKSSRKYIKKILKKGDIILIKGSNGMNLINLVDYLKQ